MESLDVFPNEVYETANSLNMPFGSGHARGQVSIPGQFGIISETGCWGGRAVQRVARS